VKPDAVRAEIEDEWTWRSDEIRLLRNQLSQMRSEADGDRFRRSLVVMLYAHFEGFCRNAFAVYIDAVNAEKLQTREAKYELASAALSDVFSALFSGDKKNRIFKSALPSDEKLHRLTRERDFLQQMSEFGGRVLQISPDIVDTESNLKPVVLRKLLFLVGLDHALCDPWEGKLNMLLHRRNNIAHGAERIGVSSTVYKEVEDAVTEIVREITAAIFIACVNETYRLPSTG
jgi:hypothetical protein